MSIWQDVKFSARMLFKDRWYTAVAILALGLGIGVNNTVFTFVNAVLLRGLPYPESDRIMHINSLNLAEGRNDMPASYGTTKTGGRSRRALPTSPGSEAGR